ncbi:hypothetical protein GCM10010317_026830 [Streptomyces mirabilis]|nr:hypothetical protein GCM10010317_026830 [Streptomyces mirabilis]
MFALSFSLIRPSAGSALRRLRQSGEDLAAVRCGGHGAVSIGDPGHQKLRDVESPAADFCGVVGAEALALAGPVVAPGLVEAEHSADDEGGQLPYFARAACANFTYDHGLDAPKMSGGIYQ